MADFPLIKLHDKLAKVAPIDGVSTGDPDDRKTWRIDFKLEATPKQRAAAQTIIDEFDISIIDPSLIKAEASRRILAKYPDWKQRNLTARGVELLNIKILNGKWSDDEAKEASVLQSIWDLIKQVRANSNKLEVMQPIPTDFTDDKWWL